MENEEKNGVIDPSTQSGNEEPQSSNEDNVEELKTELEKARELAENYKIRAEKAEKSKKAPNKKSSNQSKELDYGQKAFLKASGLKNNDEFNLAKDFANNTGKNLDDIVDNKYFQQELESFREIKTTEKASIKSNSRSTNSSKDSVEYWLAKPFGELPEDFELRKKVVKERRKKEKGGGLYN